MAEPTFMETKRDVLDGYIYESGNGQIVIDTHPSDEEHLRAPPTRTSQPMYDCRQYVRDLIPKEWVGKQGKFLIDRTVTTTGELVAVAIAFIPQG